MTKDKQLQRAIAIERVIRPTIEHTEIFAGYRNYTGIEMILNSMVSLEGLFGYDQIKQLVLL